MGRGGGLWGALKSQVHKIMNAIGWQALRRADGSIEIRLKIQFGRDHIDDIRQILANQIRVVFDVGANEGQTVRTLNRAFPCATIYSFEPDPETFQRLDASVKGLNNVRPFNVALGRESGEAQLYRFGLDETNSLLPKAKGAESYVADAGFVDEKGIVPVRVATVDEVCQEFGIGRIDLLKLDTQGYEVEVLEGAKRLLSAGQVSLVYTEVCFVRYYEGQPLFQDVYAFLHERGFRLVGLYESGFLTHYYQVGGNALFVHETYGVARVASQRLRLGRLRVCW